MALADRVKLLLLALWNPPRSNAVNHDLEIRLDAVDKRLDRIILNQYRAAQSDMKRKR